MTMKQHSTATFSSRIHRATIALLFGRVVSVPVVHARAPDRLVLVPATNLPDCARQTGEAMVLLDTIERRALVVH